MTPQEYENKIFKEIEEIHHVKEIRWLDNILIKKIAQMQCEIDELKSIYRATLNSKQFIDMIHEMSEQDIPKARK